MFTLCFKVYSNAGFNFYKQAIASSVGNKQGRSNCEAPNFANEVCKSFNFQFNFLGCGILQGVK
jgi:hypothetical protein